MIDNTTSASSLPIKGEEELAIEARAKELFNEYEFPSMEEAIEYARREKQSPSAADRLAKQNEAAGMPADRARRLAGNQARIYGEQGGQQFADRNDTPEGRARLERAWEETQQDDARHQGLYDAYFRDTGAPSHQQVDPAMAAREEYRQRWGELFDSYQRDDLHSQQPIDPGTPEQAARWDRFLADNPDEMARFRPDEFAAQQQAEAEGRLQDKMPMLVERYGPEEAAKVAAAQREGRVYVPQTKDMRERADGRRMLETQAMQGSTEARRALRQKDAEYRAAHAPRITRSLQSQARRGGSVDVEGKSDDQLRELIAENRDAEARRRDEAWRLRNMLRAGNGVAALARPGLSDWQNAAMVGGPTPLAVEAAIGARAAAMAQQAVTGFLANNPAATNEQRRMAEVAAMAKEQELPVDAAAQVERERNGGVLPGSSPAGRRKLQQIDDEIIGPIATPSEVDTAVEEAVLAGIPREDAEAYFQRRRWTGRRPAAPPGRPSGPPPPAFGPGAGGKV